VQLQGLRPDNAGVIRFTAALLGAAILLTLLFTSRPPQAAAAVPMTPAAVAGHALTQKYRCTECHTILDRGGSYGPDLTKTWSRFLARAGGDEAVARSSILAFLQHPPNATIDRRGMPDLKITPAEGRALVEFLRWTATR
jgi:mono/diheme cytochrome c family protein